MADAIARAITTTGTGPSARAHELRQPPPVQPLSAAESRDFGLAAKALWPAAGAEARELAQSLAKSAAIVRPLHVGIFNESLLLRRAGAFNPDPRRHPLVHARAAQRGKRRSEPGRLARFDVLIFPGGRAHKQADAMGENARRAVRDFIRSGGGYVGICAGGFLRRPSSTGVLAWSIRGY